jgi:hypothetical protein
MSEGWRHGAPTLHIQSFTTSWYVLESGLDTEEALFVITFFITTCAKQESHDLPSVPAVTVCKQEGFPATPFDFI